MKRVKLRHPVTGGTFEARETAIEVYRRSGWEVVDDPQAAEPAAPVLDPLPEPPQSTPEPSAPAEGNESPRGRRTKKESE
jgi:hypothetical protein